MHQRLFLSCGWMGLTTWLILAGLLIGWMGQTSTTSAHTPPPAEPPPTIATASPPTTVPPASSVDDQPVEPETPSDKAISTDPVEPTEAPPSASAREPEDLPTTADDSSAAAATASSLPDPAAMYGLWTLTPALLAIFLAIFTQQVVPSLVLGIVLGSYMMVPCLSSGDPLAQFSAVAAGFRLAAERYIFGAIIDPGDGHGHARVMMFTLTIAFTVGVIARNGGTTGMVKLVTGGSRSPRRGAVTAWLAGLVVFFDDYANTMIVGPTMQPVFDRLKISRAKLAYIVDSTAAPVASIALVGTWIGSEISFINKGLAELTAETAPAFLLDANGNVVNGMSVFLNSLAYRFYPILAIFLVLLTALTGRDFGPMKRAQRKAISQIDPDPRPLSSAGDATNDSPAVWWLGFFPILVLVGSTALVLVLTGYANGGSAIMQEAVPFWQKVQSIIGQADSYMAIFYGAILSAFTAVLLTLFARTCRAKEAVEAGLEGMSRIFPAIVILVLAWSLSSVLQDLKIGDVVVARLEQQNFPAQWLPFSVFVTAALISFATGTSYGTMGILCPMVVAVGTKLMVNMETVEAANLFFAATGSVLAGSVFGDHCSPISDTTVLSSIASGCRHEEHVWTQIPYALVAAAAAMGLGDMLCNVYRQPWHTGLGLGALFLVLWVFIVGRKPTPNFEPAEA